MKKYQTSERPNEQNETWKKAPQHKKMKWKEKTLESYSIATEVATALASPTLPFNCLPLYSDRRMFSSLVCLSGLKLLFLFSLLLLCWCYMLSRCLRASHLRIAYKWMTIFDFYQKKTFQWQSHRILNDDKPHFCFHTIMWVRFFSQSIHPKIRFAYFFFYYCLRSFGCK